MTGEFDDFKGKWVSGRNRSRFTSKGAAEFDFKY
jgi:hypothetical protein